MKTESAFIPFESFYWPARQRGVVTVIWEWHRYLRAQCSLPPGQDVQQMFDEEFQRFSHKEPLSVIPSDLAGRVYRVAEEHELPLEWFAGQIQAARVFYSPIQFDDAKSLKQFVKQWSGNHGYLLGQLADAAHTWQRKQIDELALGFFIIGALMRLPEDVQAREHVFIPMDEVAHAGVTVEQLGAGEMDAGLRRLLWKQTIRARDALAQGQPLLKELPRKYRGAFKKNWLTGLELLNVIEKQKYDLWNHPPRLSRLQNLQVRVLSVIGRGARLASR